MNMHLLRFLFPNCFLGVHQTDLASHSLYERQRHEIVQGGRKDFVKPPLLARLILVTISFAIIMVHICMYAIPSSPTDL